MAFQDEFLPIIIGTFYGGDSKNVSLKMQCLFVEKPINEVLGFDVNGKLYLSHLGKKGNEYLSHPTKPL